MENRFLELNQALKQKSGRHCRKLRQPAHALHGLDPLARAYSGVAEALSASDRALVVLLDNGGIDLEIPEFVDHLIAVLPGPLGSMPGLRKALLDLVREKLRSYTDNLIESFELGLQRFGAAKPKFFGDVIVLRDGTASYQALKSTLFDLSRRGKLIDLFILTHGGAGTISVGSDINADMIRALPAEHGKPLPLRAVYMMNCVGASLNSAWIDAGAKVVSGTVGNNYLPEPSMYFFWNAWKEGKSFDSAVTSAYQRTIALMNGAVRAFASALQIPLASRLAEAIDFAEMDFVKSSAPVIAGQGTLTVNSDGAGTSVAKSLSTTVLSQDVLQALSDAVTNGAATSAAPARELSPEGLTFLKSFEREAGGLEERARACQRALNEAVQVKLSQNQNDAIVSFICNIGADAFRRSTLLAQLNRESYASVPLELRKWVKVRQGGRVLDSPDLVRRREAEAELFVAPAVALSASLSRRKGRHSFVYSSPSAVMSTALDYSRQLNPGMVAGIAVADAAEIGLSAVSVVQAQASASQGSFTLNYDKAQRLLTTEARVKMPGAQKAKQSYTRRLFYMGIERYNTAKADIIVVWEGNVYGEIGTPVIRRDLATSDNFERSSVNLSISKVDRIPLPNTDPRAWPIVYTYDGSYDPFGNGLFEFSGEFELNAFGGLKFNRHQVVSRALIDWVLDSPEGYVQKGPDAVVPVPAIPKEQLDYLKARLP